VYVVVSSFAAIGVAAVATVAAEAAAGIAVAPDDVMPVPVTFVVSALERFESLPVQVTPVARMWPAGVVPESPTVSVEDAAVLVAVSRPVAVAVPPGVKFVVNVAEVPVSARVPSVVPLTSSPLLAAKAGLASAPAANIDVAASATKLRMRVLRCLRAM
jgi:hypothetical protein